MTPDSYVGQTSRDLHPHYELLDGRTVLANFVRAASKDSAGSVSLLCPVGSGIKEGTA